MKLTLQQALIAEELEEMSEGGYVEFTSGHQVERETHYIYLVDGQRMCFIEAFYAVTNQGKPWQRNNKNTPVGGPAHEG